jgi:hypothetical protein
MADLFQSLQHHDLGFLRIVAGLWGVELNSQDPDEAIDELKPSLLDPELAAELLTSLSVEARDALSALMNAGGRIPWAAFGRQFGGVRDMGAGRRDREKPHLHPVSAAEMLFYRALLFRAFFNTDRGPQEFAYIPDDLLEIIRQQGLPKSQGGVAREKAALRPEAAGRGATPLEKKHILPATDRILDDATTMLAALRLGLEFKPDPKLTMLLQAAGLLSAPARPSTAGASAKKKIGGAVNADKAKAFLEATRSDALQTLIEAWQTSEAFNELRLLPGLVFEGEWTNQPRVTRDFLLDLLHAIPHSAWWSLNAFASDIKKLYPDFQRPAGDYDSWFIKREADGIYLRGFAYWEQVDGALIRFFVADILHWLGMLELGTADEHGPATSFHLLDTPIQAIEETGKISIASSGKIIAPRTVPRAVRYQLARFCDWDEEKPDEYRYHITPRSLTRAAQQDLKVEHLLALLARHAEAGVSPVLVKALKRWEANGTEARAETQVILKVSRPEILEELRKSKAARFLGEPLGPTSVVIKAGAQPKVMAALAELGLLAEDNTLEGGAPK